MTEEENLLGRNIQTLRTTHGETLEELGDVVGYSKTAVKGYENGSRKPDLETLKKIAMHYNVAMDELVHSELEGFLDFQFDLNSASDMVNLTRNLFPLCDSQEEVPHDDFRRGYELSEQLLEGLSEGRVLPGSTIGRIFQCFLKAAEETDDMAAYADVLWCIFLWWIQIGEGEETKSRQNRQGASHLSFKGLMRCRDAADEKVRAMRLRFIESTDSLITEILKALKAERRYEMLADYYLALRYLFDLANTGLTSEMNSTVGIQMMLSFEKMGNTPARRFCRIFGMLP